MENENLSPYTFIRNNTLLSLVSIYSSANDYIWGYIR
jgi:hypothetical protein